MIPNHHVMQSDFVELDPGRPVHRASRSFRLGTRELHISLAANDQGLLECRIEKEETSDAGTEGPSGGTASVLHHACIELDEYFQGRRMTFTVPLSPVGTDFQKQVWMAARQIPYGQVRSYWWVAVRMGNPHAARAVGGALRDNPLAIFIPCHRVVRQDGSLGGFAPGIEWKQLLLSHEEQFKDELYEKFWPSHLT